MIRHSTSDPGPTGRGGTAAAWLGVVVVAIVAASFTACSLRTPSSPPISSAVGPSAPPPSDPHPADGGFSIGLEYGLPGLAEAYAPMGIGRVKPAIEFGVWGNIEPSRGTRDWRPLDTIVAEYQAAGFADLQLLISADSPWAARTPHHDPMPQDRFLDDYAAFVTAFVERYDGDGVDDAPGLRSPVHEYGVEREFTGFWPSPAADYRRLLDRATPAIRAADPSATILLVGILAVDVFDGAPDGATIDRRWSATPGFRKSRADVEAILAACDRYDAVDVHSLGDATELPPTLAWVRARLAAAGCPDRPIWIGDAFPSSPLIAYNARPFHPAIAADVDAIVAVLGIAADPGAPGHASAIAWVRAETARGVVRKVVLAAAAGARGINIGNLEDWATGLPVADRLLAVGIGTAEFGGLRDTTRALDRPGGGLPFDGDGFSFARMAGAVRPAGTALGLVAAATRSATSVERIDVGDPRAWVYAVVAPDGPRWIGWADEARIHLAGDPGPTVHVEIEVRVGRVSIQPFPSTSATIDPSIERPGIPSLSIDLGLTPVLITVAG